MERQSVVVIGGGFAGSEVARRLGTRFDVTLVASENFLLFTPMLAEVAAADIEPRHILAPLRELCPRAHIVVGETVAVDVATRTVTVRPEVGRERTLAADHLVLAAGSVPNTFGVDGVEQHAIGFKTITDATRIRRRLLAFLETAAETGDGSLTKVAIVGAGYSGAEAAASLADFLADASARYYPEAPEPEVSLVDFASRVTPALTERLSGAAERALRARGVSLVLGKKVERVTEAGVVIEDGTRVDAKTVIWAAGVKAHPVGRATGLETDRSGRIVVDKYFRAAPGTYALGDTAAVPDGHGGICPPTAQHAMRQGKHLGRILPPMALGNKVAGFRYRTKGQLVSLGHRNAVGLVMGIPVSGFPAWFMWRSYYWWRLPTMLRKARVAIDWTLDLMFPPDITALTTEELGPLPEA